MSHPLSPYEPHSILPSSLDVSENGVCGLDAEGEGSYTASAVRALCSLLRTEGNQLHTLKIGQNQICGVNWKGRGRYTSEAVQLLCDALRSRACRLRVLKIFGNCWGNRDTLALADALSSRAVALSLLDMRWNEMGSEVF